MKAEMCRLSRYGLFLGACAGLAAACGGGGGGGGSSRVDEGDEVVFTVQWEGPADLDLSLITPSGSRVSFSNPSAGGCSLDGDAGGTSGALFETITCPSVTGGTYQAFVENLESFDVEADFQITSLGEVIHSESFRVSPEEAEGPFQVDVRSGSTPVEGIEGAWREDRARLVSSNCSDDLDDLFRDILPSAGGVVIVERNGDNVTVTDPDETVTAHGTVDGTVIDVDAVIRESGAGCSVRVDLNLQADLGRDPATATYDLDWGFSGCPGFFDCQQVIEARWRR